MSYRKILAYLKTVETGSITKAAAELDYTQPAISRMISDLENLWGVRLLARNHSGIKISSEGMLLLPIMQSIVKNYEDLEFAISELHGAESGILRVGAFTSMATGWLPLMLKAFHEQHPNIRFQLINGEYNQIADWLRLGMVDCGFISLPTTNDLQATFLLQDALVAILPPDHPLADADCFPVSQLAYEDFIDLKEEQDHEIKNFLEHLQQKPNIKYEVTNDFAILSMVECGLGISVVHELILHPSRHGVVKKAFDVPQFRNIGIAVSRAFQPSAITRLFIEHAENWARELQPAMELGSVLAAHMPPEEDADAAPGA